MNTLRIMAISIAVLLIQACSHPIEIVGQGDVTSESGNRNCSLEQFTAADAVCSKNYAVGAYQETYYAKPRAGYQFDHWGNNYCPGAPAPNYDCSFDFAAATVYQFWGQTMPPLQAVFTPLTGGGTPITDTVAANGKTWAQPDLFGGLTWNQINAVCPSGICAVSGVLNGHDMTGWRWASVDDMNALFNATDAGLNLGPGPDKLSGAFDLYQYLYTTYSAFINGPPWRPYIAQYAQGIAGWTATPAIVPANPSPCSPLPCSYYAQVSIAYNGFFISEIGTDYQWSSNSTISSGQEGFGAWFFR